MGWSSDSDDEVDLSWADDIGRPPIAPCTAGPSNGRVKDGASCSGSMPYFLAMGFQKDMIARAIQEAGEGNTESILNHLLTYSVLDENPPANGRNEENNQNTPSDENDWADDDVYSDVDDFDDMDFELEMLGQASRSKKLRTLEEMGFSRSEASLAIDRCGEDVPISELADSIYAAQTQAKEDGVYEDASNSYERKDGDKYDPFVQSNKRQRFDPSSGTRRSSTQARPRVKRAHHRPNSSNRCNGEWDGEEDSLNLPNPMVGFGLPTDPNRQLFRRLSEEAKGPPYFFYENVALTPKGVWQTISRFLYEIPPEYIDSKYFSAACRKRGYIHNLPIENRFALEPPPMTIQDAFPSSRPHWPAWDNRTQFNCLQTCTGSAKLNDRIRERLESSPDPPPPEVVRYVMYECKKWNLIWVGRNRVAPLECDEVEYLLGFPRNHTRGTSRTERYKSLGNSFQVHTIAYQLSVLKDLYPHGIRVLSLFTGIGGAEVALDRLGIKMTAVLSVEISPINRTILRNWWNDTRQEGELMEIDDVQRVSDGMIESFIARHGGIDLVIGGSPCNNLAGSNRHHRDGLEGEHSSLFFHYSRILETVRRLMRHIR